MANLPVFSIQVEDRIADLRALAFATFETETAADVWLQRVHPMLGQTPLEAALTVAGARSGLLVPRHANTHG